MSQGLDNLRHIVVLMMENRSFDHMLGSLKTVDPRINGLNGHESNPDTTNEPAPVQPLAEYQSQLDPDPDHHFPAVNKQLFFGTAPGDAPAMNGFVQSYFDQQNDVAHSRKIMYYFKPEQRRDASIRHDGLGFRRPVFRLATKLECFDRLHILTLLRLHQSIKVALHAVHELFRECSLNLSATQRTRQGPADPPPIKASIEPITPGVNRSWADAQIRCAATCRLPAAFLDIPTVQAHQTSSIHISVKSGAPSSRFGGGGRNEATPQGSAARFGSTPAIFAIIGHCFPAAKP
jgi:hypothetical protein